MSDAPHKALERIEKAEGNDIVHKYEVLMVAEYRGYHVDVFKFNKRPQNIDLTSYYGYAITWIPTDQIPVGKPLQEQPFKNINCADKNSAMSEALGIVDRLIFLRSKKKHNK